MIPCAQVLPAGCARPCRLLYVLLFLQFSCNTFYDPARRALVPTVVPAEQLPLATTLDSFAWSLMGAFGASLGGLAVSAHTAPGSRLGDEGPPAATQSGGCLCEALLVSASIGSTSSMLPWALSGGSRGMGDLATPSWEAAARLAVPCLPWRVPVGRTGQ